MKSKGRTWKDELGKSLAFVAIGLRLTSRPRLGPFSGSNRRRQDFKPDLGNSAVRHHRGPHPSMTVDVLFGLCVLARTGIPFSQREHDERVCFPASRRWVVTDILQHNPNHLNILNTFRYAERCVCALLRCVLHEQHFNLYTSLRPRIPGTVREGWREPPRRTLR